MNSQKKRNIERRKIKELESFQLLDKKVIQMQIYDKKKSLEKSKSKSQEVK